MAETIQQLTDPEIDEEGVVSAPDTLTGTPQQNKAVFDNLVKTLIKQKVNEIIGATNGMLEAEEETAEAEAERVTAEEGRVAAEEGRVSAENLRVTAEKDRAEAEDDREEAETLRATAEQGRVSAESERASAESLRVTAEEGRVSAESTRLSNETTRESNESTRKSNETGRVKAESLRVTAEGLRATAEQERATAENGRVSAEGLRVTAEQGRVSAESGRASAETSRVKAEQGRASAESTRESNETTRQSNEATRQSNEQKRAAAENARNVWENYDNEKSYVPGNKVAYNGSSYLNIAPCSGVLPSDTEHWLLIAAKGVDGEGAGDMLQSVYDPQKKAQDIFGYVDNKTASDFGAIPAAQKGTAGGVATLGADGRLTSAQTYSLLQSISAAAAYDPSSTYSEGDYCTYHGQLYKANKDISAAEPWTAAHWTATSIMAEVGAHVEDKDNPHNVTAAQTGAIPAPAGGSAGQVLTKTETAQEWQDMPASAAAVTVTFTADQWTGTDDPYTLTIPQTQHKRAGADFIFQVFGMDGDGKYAKNTWEALEVDMEYTASTGEFKLISATKFAGKIVFVG